MKSVRLPPTLEAKLSAAARLEGISEPALIRQAIEQRGGVAERTGEAFVELLRERAAAFEAEAGQVAGGASSPSTAISTRFACTAVTAWT